MVISIVKRNLIANLDNLIKLPQSLLEGQTHIQIGYYSTVTLLAKFLGWSTLQPLSKAI